MTPDEHATVADLAHDEAADDRRQRAREEQAERRREDRGMDLWTGAVVGSARVLRRARPVVPVNDVERATYAGCWLDEEADHGRALGRCLPHPLTRGHDDAAQMRMNLDPDHERDVRADRREDRYR